MKKNELNMTLPEEHYKETCTLLKAIDKNKIATWLRKLTGSSLAMQHYFLRSLIFYFSIR